MLTLNFVKYTFKDRNAEKLERRKKDKLSRWRISEKCFLKKKKKDKNLIIGNM